MVLDLSNLQSHPNKLLKTHINGVKSKALLRNPTVITEYAALFHDFGKINPNFQQKLKGIKNAEYSQHSYISAYALLNWYITNRENANKILTIEGYDLTKLKIVAAIILHHHGDLPNMDQNVLNTPYEAMIEYLKDNFQKLPISDYLKEELGFAHNNFDLSIKKWDLNKLLNIDLGNENELEAWSKNALEYYLETQYSFASVIESDKRDAASNDFLNFSDSLKQCVNQLNDGLDLTFSQLSEKAKATDLNKLRTEIRIEAVETISNLLQTNQRIFTLTAPTGAGKTYTLLAIAKEIQKNKGNLGIIFALPFLSITEQVQEIIDTIGIDSLSVNSKAFNERIEKAQNDYETNQTNEKLKGLLIEDFIETTFDHPFVITTFVQLFESLLSNRNSALLKLPNFSNRIFLIDELQALPPRLYIFFSAWLDAFCKRYNSYAILSTATMPNLEIPEKKELEGNSKYRNKAPSLLFKNYQTPNDLLKPQKFFSENVFNRYKINVLNNSLTIDDLSVKIKQETLSCLIILNTIQDTKDLFEKLSDSNSVYLLNTHFTPNDRLQKINTIKKRLYSEKIILISTQLIEAGVDVDFPVVYRDLCPLPSLIQSAGRCNRNKRTDFGQVNLIQLVKENGKLSSELVYRKEAKQFLNFIRENITGVIEEKDLFIIQKAFFKSIATNLEIGEYPEGGFNLIEKVNLAQFQSVGEFQLINDNIFGKQYQYYVPLNDIDENFEILENIAESISPKDYEEARKIKIALNLQLKKMSGQIVSIRVRDESDLPIQTNRKDIYGLKKISLEYYTFEKGIAMNKKAFCFL